MRCACCDARIKHKMTSNIKKEISPRTEENFLRTQSCESTFGIAVTATSNSWLFAIKPNNGIELIGSVACIVVFDLLYGLSVGNLNNGHLAHWLAHSL